MIPAVQRWFQKCERQRASILAEVASWPATRQTFRQAPASWSALQLLDHLVKVDRGVLGNIRYHLPAGRPIKIKNKCYSAVVFATLMLPTRVGVPAGAGPIQPDADPDWNTLTSQWDAVRTEMSELLGTLQPGQSRSGLFRHPISGYMNIHRTMQFLFAHTLHHQYQLRRIRAATRASKN